MDEDDGRTHHSWLRYSTLGWQFALTMVLCVLLGTWLDGRLGTDPWLTIAGSLLGIFGSMYLVIREVGRG
jgi:F0F1-type ATP synthase assembly protein I